MTETLRTPPAAAVLPARARLGWLLTIILAGQFMAILDVSIVNVAAPTLQADLGASGSALQLIVSGYTISYAVLLIVGARLGGLAGHRKIFQLGLAVFTVASLACGLAGTSGQLIGFRLLQGAGAALMVPQVFSFIQREFTGAARARALSLYAAVIAGGMVVGQVLGGALVSADLLGTGWRPVFLVNVPVGVLLLAAGARLLPADDVHEGLARRRGALDLPGMLTLSLSVMLFVVPLVLGREKGWPLWGWVSLIAAALVFLVFAGWERRAAEAPLFPGRVLRAPGMAPAALAVALGMASFGGFLFSVALHLQGGLGNGALSAGLLFIPGAGGFALASLTWQRVPQHRLRILIPAGYVLAAAGYAGAALAVRGGGSAGPGFEIALGCAGLGMGAAFSPLLTVALGKVAPADAPHASGLLMTITQLSQVVGVATFGTLFLARVDAPGALVSGQAAAVTLAALAVTTLGAAGAVLLLPKARAPQA